MNHDLARIHLLDNKLIAAARSIKILSSLEWPQPVAAMFLESIRRKQPVLPAVPFRFPDTSVECRALDEIILSCDCSHPLEGFLHDTAQSYLEAADLIAAQGTDRFTTLSQKIYGTPSDLHLKGQHTMLQTAEHFIETTSAYLKHPSVVQHPYCILAETVARELQAASDAVFKDHPIAIKVDGSLTAKAAAGAHSIRLRGATCFSSMDIPQIIQHELFVHSLTSINGRAQPVLKSLGLGAPRTTKTQEGLALFAEFITNSIDISRLRRIALRVKAVQMAIDGNDFLKVFEFFTDSGQHELESFYSTMRIFRGGDAHGGVTFTKDIVYISGLMLIHSFFLRAIEEGKVDFPRWAFVGRMTIGDIFRLQPCIQDGTIAPPLYLPEWVKDPGTLAAFLSYSSFVTTVDSRRLRLKDFQSS